MLRVVHPRPRHKPARKPNPAHKAEGEGFEPSVGGLPLQRFSRPPRSTTPAPLRGCAFRRGTGEASGGAPRVRPLTCPLLGNARNRNGGTNLTSSTGWEGPGPWGGGR